MQRVVHPRASSIVLLVSCLSLLFAAHRAGAAVPHPLPASSLAPAHVATGRPLFLLTGRSSEMSEASYHLVTDQERFDELWIAHAGDRVERAAQGWPMPPRLDFERCVVLLVFGGDRTNTNGFRVVDIVDDPVAGQVPGHASMTVRVEVISFQTSSIDGADPGVPGRPWALILLERRPRALALEENVQRLIGGAPIWKERAMFAAPSEPALDPSVTPAP